MFTGIIRHTGVVTRVQATPGGARMAIDAGALAGDLSNGDSLCVNGVCLTAVSIRDGVVEFDVIEETLRRSTLRSFRKGQRANLEMSLRVGDTIDGHFVQGHVDGTATLARRAEERREHLFWFEPEDRARPYLIPKGSVTIDGVSLTIADASRGEFSVALIPTTLDLTTIGSLRKGDQVNVESDIITRTVIHRLSCIEKGGGITLDELQAQGFA